MHTHKHTENVAQVCSWPQAQFLSYRIYVWTVSRLALENRFTFNQWVISSLKM